MAQPAGYDASRYQQGYQPSESTGGYSDYRGGRAPPARDPGYERDSYPGPRRAHFNDAYSASQQSFQPSSQAEYGYEDVGDRPRDGPDPRAAQGNELAMYDEEKAYAQYTDAYGPPPLPEGQQSSRPQRRPPPDDDRRYDDRRYDDRRYDDRRYDDRRYDDRPRYSERGGGRYDARPPYDDYDRRPPGRVSYADGPPAQRSPPSKNGGGGKDILRQGDGERGLGATLLGGAAGAFLGEQADKGPLSTIGGAVLGAIAAKAGEKQIEKRRGNKENDRAAMRRYESEYSAGGVGPYHGGRDSRSELDHERYRREGMTRNRQQRRRRKEDSSEDSYTSDE